MEPRAWVTGLRSFALVALLATGYACAVRAQEQAPEGVQAEGGQKEQAPKPPAASELVPLATDLSARFADLDSTLGPAFDSGQALERLAEYRDESAKLAEHLETLKTATSYGYDQLADLKAAVEDRLDKIESLNQEITDRLARLEALRKTWSTEKATWEQWRRELPEDLPRETVAPVFTEVQRTAENALEAIGKRLSPLLEAQRRVGEVQSRLQTQAGTLEAMMEQVKGQLFRKSAPSMFSPRYFAQFDAQLWRQLAKSVKGLPWPSLEYFGTWAWLILLQVGTALAIFFGIHHSSRTAAGGERWRFVRDRPLALALFVTVAALTPLYGPLNPVWRLFLWTVAGIAAARLIAGLLDDRWKAAGVYLLAALFLLAMGMEVLSVPMPLFRLYVLGVAVAGLPLCWWRARESSKRGDSALYTWSLRGGAGIFAVAAVAQIGGYTSFSTYLLGASIQTVFLVLLAWMLAILVRGGLEYVLQNSLVARVPLLRENAPIILMRLSVVTDVLVGLATLGMLLQVWRLYESPTGALAGLLSLGFTVGEQRVTLGLALTGFVVLYLSLVVSRLLQALLSAEVYPRRQLELGTALSMNRLVHYAIVLVGFLAALTFVGFDLRNVTILAGAFGIGIGFGLQNVVNNFVSGLILLFERPIKVGDVVQLGTEWGEIRRLGLRATVVQTYDRSEIIVPNSDLIANQVVNWTYSDKSVRFIVGVGVAYGSDVPLVMQILREVAEEHPKVLSDPTPTILFQDFGSSSLDFELRAWIGDVGDRLSVGSDIREAIDRKFREHGVEIPFPQRDLHLRSVEEPAAAGLFSPWQRRSKVRSEGLEERGAES